MTDQLEYEIDADSTSTLIPVYLNYAPQGTLTVPVKSLQPEIGAVSPAELVFSAGNWDTPQMITASIAGKAPEQTKSFALQIGPSAADDPVYKNASPTSLSIKIIGRKQIADPPPAEKTTIKLNFKSVKLYRNNKITIAATVSTPDSANQNVSWTLQNITGTNKDNVSDIVTYQKSGKHHELITITSHSVGARKLLLTAKTPDNVKAEATIYVKPYTRYYFSGNRNSKREELPFLPV